ncbi:hypothetical protein L1987_30311 [Smallanthus sonchifolius]|uniref:Uncharacterized protein n=1 Tax=Smallanthus sonchifolius TaxID=185202 RepID=A0ACB9I3Y3_9ASTR|nr:hypothetical protein L1987_30311 [Smallanthus sonchifolius]
MYLGVPIHPHPQLSIFFPLLLRPRKANSQNPHSEIAHPNPQPSLNHQEIGHLHFLHQAHQFQVRTMLTSFSACFQIRL